MDQEIHGGTGKTPAVRGCRASKASGIAELDAFASPSTWIGAITLPRLAAAGAIGLSCGFSDGLGLGQQSFELANRMPRQVLVHFRNDRGT